MWNWLAKRNTAKTGSPRHLVLINDRILLLVLPCVALFVLSGCSAIRVGDADPQAAFAERRGDSLTTGTFSAQMRSALFALGGDAERCQRSPAQCISRLHEVGDRITDTSLAVLAELSIAKALEKERSAWGTSADQVIADYLEAARFAYAFLFLGSREPAERVLETRQNQVRDYYNFATERVAALMFQRTPRPDAAVLPVEGVVGDVGGWKVDVGQVEVRLPIGAERLQAIVSPSRLQIRGLRNTYRRDGLGTELVAVWTPDSAGRRENPMAEIGFTRVASRWRIRPGA